jgi:glycerol transport system ATP-binding protein
MNFCPVRLEGDAVLLGQQRLQIEAAQLQALKNSNGELKLGIRPEFVELAAPGTAGAVSAEVTQVQHLGTSQLVTAQFEGMSVKARVAPELKIATGAQWLRLAKPETIYFSNDERIGR